MIFDSAFNPLLLTSMAITLLHFLWQGLAVALILGCLLKVIDNQHSRLRYACSSIAMVLNLLLPIITFLIVHQPESGVINKTTSLHVNHLLGLTILPEKTSLNQTVLSLLPYLTLIWFMAIAYLAVKLLYQMAAVNQLPKQGVIPPQDFLYTRFNELIVRLDINQKVNLLISTNIDVPMAVGWLKPVVLLPASMLTGLTSAQLEMLLLHELAHIKRYDYLANVLQSIVEILLFFHPAVFWVSKQMRIEREYCSDDIAVKYCGDALAYAHTLTDTASLCHQHRHATPSMAMSASGGDLKQRVLRLVSHHHCLTGYDKSKWLGAITVVSAIFLFTSTQVKHLGNYQYSGFTSSAVEFTSKNYQKLIPSINTQTEPYQEKSQENAQTSTTSLQYDLAVKMLSEIPFEKTQDIDEEYINGSRIQFIESVHAFAKTSKKEHKTDENHRKASSPLLEKLNQPIQHKDPIAVFQQSNTTTKAVALHTEYSTAEHNSPPAQQQQIFTQEVEKELNKGNYQTAQVLSFVQPKYPYEAERKNIQMSLIVNFSIDALGDINNIEIENKNKSHYFTSSIKSALKKWEFLPAERDGQPVNSNMTRVFSFYLKR